MRTPQSMRRIVAGDPVLAAWDARRRHEAALTHAVRSELPRQLAARIRVADTQHTTLEIVADSGAVAAAVRQRLPGVLERLARDGYQFTGMHVRVQLRPEDRAPPKIMANPIDSAASAKLDRLARNLLPGPLRASLERLLRGRR